MLYWIDFVRPAQRSKVVVAERICRLIGARRKKRLKTQIPLQIHNFFTRFLITFFYNTNDVGAKSWVSILVLSKSELQILPSIWHLDFGFLTESDNLVEVEVEFDYEAELSDELSLKTGEIIENVKRMDGGWWEGTLNGKRGVFPDNFVKVRLVIFLPLKFVNFGIVCQKAYM